MSEPDRTSDNSGKTPWNWILVTGALCAIPILPAAGGYPVVGFSMLAIVILAYWALVKVYGDGFVVEGGWGRTTNLLGNNQVLCQLSYAPSLVQRSVGPVVP